MITNTTIKNLLLHQPLTSSKLLAAISENSHITKNNARVSLSRLSEKDYHISNLSLMHNEHYFYLSDQLPMVINDLAKRADNEPVVRLIKALLDLKFLFTSEYLKLLGQPISEKKGHKDAHKYIIQLHQDRIIDIINADTIDEYICFTPKIQKQLNQQIKKIQLESRRLSLTMQENVVSDCLDRWKKEGILSWNYTKQFRLNGLQIQNFHFKQHFFDAYGYCYIAGISMTDSKTKKKKPVPVVVEAMTYRTIKKIDIASFENSIKNINFTYKTKVIPVLIYGKSMPHSVFTYAKRCGIALVSMMSIYNSDLPPLLTELSNYDFSNIDELSNEIKNINNTNNLRGSLFNSTMAYFLMMCVGFSNVQINQIYSSDKISREIDVVVELNDQSIIIIFELKCYTKSKIKLGCDEEEEDSVKKFFESTRSVAESHFLEHDRKDKTIIPIFISLSGFEQDAIEYMENYKQLLKKVSDIPLKFPKKLFYTKQDLLHLSDYKTNSPQNSYGKFRNIIKEL